MSLNRKPYKFEYIGGQSNAYVFETGNEVIYQIKFKPTPYLFSNHPNVGQNVFELVIEVIDWQGEKIPPDSFIPATVAAICQDFFINKDRILLYICETADARHLARVRKFDAWFRAFTESNFLKIDTQFPDTNGITYYISLIFRLGHPHRHLIVDEFELMSRQYNTGN